MYKHTETAHPLEIKHNFEFKVVKTFSSALMRQVTEAVLIRRQEGTVLNSKGVYNRCHLPRLTVESCNKKEEEGGERERSKNNQENCGPWQNTYTRKRYTHPEREKNSRKRIKLDQNQVGGENPRLEGVQYKKSKEGPKCTGLFLLYKWIEFLFDHGNVLSTSIAVAISNNFCLKIFVW